MTTGDDSPADAGEHGGRQWLATPWYRSRLGRFVVVFDVLLTIALVFLTLTFFTEMFTDPTDFVNGAVPGFVYVFALLGALGYVFTTLTDDFHRTTGDMIQYNFRLPAALPLGAGVFVLTELILIDAAASPALVSGLVFLSGLYVNLAYVQMGALARRLLPGRSEGVRGSA